MTKKILNEYDKYFDPSVFTISKDIQIQEISNSLGKIFLVENFYEDLHLVNEEIKKLPMTLLWDEKIKKTISPYIIDARKSYASSMKGTELPFLTKLPKIISKYINEHEVDIQPIDSLLVNCCKKLENYPKDTYYNIHFDENFADNIKDSYAFVIFLNESYEDETVGFNIYHPKKIDHNKFFYDKSEVELFAFIKAKPNRAVLLHNSIMHGQENGLGSQFYEEWRLTQVVFYGIFSNFEDVNNFKLKQINPKYN